MALGLAAAGMIASAATATTPAVAAPPGSKPVTVQLFEWKWTDVAKECETVLGPQGFGGVQISPPQEHIVLPGQGYPWWQKYQPISYKIEGRSGNRAQFTDMVNRCNAAGVKIYADVVINHMAGTGQSGTGSAGSTFSDYTFPAVPYGPGDFNDCKRSISNWGNRDEIRNCNLLALADLRTGSEHVRTKLADYLNDLLAIGVAGFRVDAAKHVPVADFQAIYGKLTKPYYVYHEVYSQPGDVVPSSEYAVLGDAGEFAFGPRVGNAVRDGNLASLQNIGSDPGWMPADKAKTWIDNHDTQRDGTASLTYKSGAELYDLANAFLLAHPYGSPVLMSSYRFDDKEAGPPSNGGNTTKDVDCAGGEWICEHRRATISGMVGFRNSAGTAALQNWWTNGSNQVAFSRGDKAFAVFNRGGSTLQRTFSTGLPDGSYCNVYGGRVSGTTCTAGSVTVSGGQASISVPAGQVVALHVGARGGACTTGCEQGAVQVGVSATTTPGQTVRIVGDDAALGGWAPASGVALTAGAGSTWSGRVSGLAAGTTFRYKYVKVDGAGTVVWESGADRTATVPASGTLTLADTFRGDTVATTQAVSFAVGATTTYGQNVHLVGSSPQLGAWDPAKAIALSSAAYPTWRTTAAVDLPANTRFEYKYVKKNPDGTYTWEGGANRTYTTGASGSVGLSDTWR
ncbi:carbohydrate-binding module family 20 domain-containing protein [Kineococcus glutinatus]|uniref:Alpha-amylase n=1 Tax=Kineococcus glutinatus TaxID=1070872 RepID=A0ABP9HAV9_9ACTN